MIGISKPKMYELIRANEIPSIHVGKRLSSLGKPSLTGYQREIIMARKRANGEGALRKRSNGKWEARYSVNGKRHSIYGNSQTEVRKKLTEATSPLIMATVWKTAA